MITLLIILLILMLIGVLPGWPYMASRNYGYYPSGLLTIVIVILIVLLLLGRL